VGQKAEGVTLADLVESVERLRKESSAANTKLVRALSGDEEGTLLGQIKLLRADGKDESRRVIEKLDETGKQTVVKIDEVGKENVGKIDEMKRELVSEFRAFAETMAQQNTDALIDALSAIIRDFNENLTEQFGENFQQLNKAVGQLVQWQAQYRKILEDTYRHLLGATDAAKSSATALSSIQSDF
jgi:hypothetical protein